MASTRLGPAMMTIASILLLAACSARMESPAARGQIENYRHKTGIDRSIRISWKCGSRGLFSTLFHPTGVTGCNDERGRGEVTIPIDDDGRFEIPEFDVTVRKFFSAPSLYVDWTMLTQRGGDAVDEMLLTGSKLYDFGSFERMVDEYSTLSHVAIEDACVAAAIIALDGERKFAFDQLPGVYPASYNHRMLYTLGITLKRGGQVLTSQNFRFDYADGAFCGRDIGLFVPSNSVQAEETLHYFADIGVNATVVYAKSTNPVSGQVLRDSRHVEDRIVRRAEVAVAATNRLPESLLLPLSIELDVTRAASD